MALTATANESVIKNIIDQLDIPTAVHLKQSFNRQNLHYAVCKKAPNIDSTIRQIAAIVNSGHPNHSGIIYCLSKGDCEAVAQKLREVHGLNAAHFHAGMTQADKRRTQDRWYNGEVLIIVATVGGITHV